jgi:hypothetical protein
VIVRRSDYLESLAEGVRDDRLVAWLAGRGRRTVYTPDTSISASPPPVLAEHLRSTLREARARGGAARVTRGSSMSAATAISLVPLGLALVALGLVVAGGPWTTVGVAILAGYGALLVLSAALAAVRFRSAALGALMPFVLVATQLAYVGGFVSGLVAGTSRRGSSARPANDLDA